MGMAYDCVMECGSSATVGDYCGACNRAFDAGVASALEDGPSDRTRLIAEMASRIAAGMLANPDMINGHPGDDAVELAERILQRVEGGGGDGE